MGLEIWYSWNPCYKGANYNISIKVCPLSSPKTWFFGRFNDVLSRILCSRLNKFSPNLVLSACIAFNNDWISKSWTGQKIMSACANSDEELCQITNPAEKLKMLYILQMMHFSEQVLTQLALRDDINTALIILNCTYVTRLKASWDSFINNSIS